MVKTTAAPQEQAPIWLFGVLLCVLGTTLTALGLVLQKYSHIKNAKRGDALVYFRQPWWQGGFTVFLTGQLFNLAAMALAPQTVLSCLGVWSLVFNAAFAWIILGEQIQRSELLSMVGMIAGVVLVILSMPGMSSPSIHGGIQDILQPLVSPTLLEFTACMAALVAVLWLATLSCAPDLMPVFWALTSAISSGYTVTLFKCLAVLALSVRPPWPSFQPYVVLGVALLLCVGQVHTLNLALNGGRAMTVVPASFAFSLMAQIVTAQAAFQELSELPGPRQATTFGGGLLLILVCIVALMRAKISVDEALKAEVQTPLVVHPRVELETSPLWRLDVMERCQSFSSLDSQAFPESFEGGERAYMVSVTGPMGIA
mmetsp:Transcript_63709/g.205302  ORF Transcript_63709/g.205302 Transcript_63709/m.205302 type:complete len:371 (+) Transcript_63709:84-1196(+)